MMRNKKSMSPLVCDTSKHRAFKHDDWTVLEEWYLKHKGKVPWWVKG